MPKKSRREETKTSPAVKTVIGTIVGTIIFFALLCIFALAALKTGISRSLYFPAALAAGALSGLFAGFTAARAIKKNGLLFGAAAGLGASLICIAVSAMASGGAEIKVLALPAVMTVFAALGGIAAVNLGKRTKY